MRSKIQNLVVLGSTGSIGRATLDVVRQMRDSLQVFGLAANSNHQMLAEQIREFQPEFAVLSQGGHAMEALVKALPDTSTKLLTEEESLCELASHPKTHHVMAAMVGAIGLKPVYAAVQAGKRISLANKEVMVMAGELIVKQAQRNNAILLPVDSEHNGLFQCLQAAQQNQVEELILTASGGALRDTPLEMLPHITKAQALDHPNWNMGQKITIDSATMMNKGLEIIEARWLFNIPVSRINTLIHRESIVHAMVRFVDGSILAQLGPPDMRLPIAHCLAWPKRLPLNLPRLEISQLKQISFQKTDPRRYPCLELVRKAISMGGGIPAAINGANETIVNAYLNDAFPFIKIPLLLKQSLTALQKSQQQPHPPAALMNIHSIKDALIADTVGRQMARQAIKSIC